MRERTRFWNSGMFGQRERSVERKIHGMHSFNPMFFTILAIRSLLIISYIGRMGLSLTSTIFELKTSHKD